MSSSVQTHTHKHTNTHIYMRRKFCDIKVNMSHMTILYTQKQSK